MLKKIVTLLTGSLSAKILQFVYFFWIVKIFSKDLFGQYSVALTVFMIFLNPLLEFGTELIITKESAKQNSKKYYQVLYWKLLAFLPGVFVITAIGMKFFQLDITLLLSCSVLVFCRSIELSNAAFLRGRDLSRIESLHLSVSRSISIFFLAVNILFFKE